jgi:chromosome segregation ATPase
MAWWDDVLNIMRDEFGGTKNADTLEPASAKQAEGLLKRTSRELANAKARAEAARRRLLRAQDDLQKLTQQPGQTDSFRDRLTTLAKSITHESELVEAFDAHIQRLSDVQERVQRTMQRFERDLQMARTAKATAAATHHIAPVTQKRAEANVNQPAGFRHAHDGQVLN